MTTKRTKTAKKTDPTSDLPNLSYRRSIEVADASMWSVDQAGNEHVLTVTEQRGRAVKSFHTETKKATEASDDTSNIVCVETAMLPPRHNKLRVKFALTMLDNALEHNTTNQLEKARRIDRWVKARIKPSADGVDLFGQLGFLYAQTLASGNWLWRNRELAYHINITVTDVLTKDSWTFVPMSMLEPEKATPRLMKTPGLDESEFPEETLKALKAIGTRMRDALTSEDKKLFLEVEATLDMTAGAEVYPSQEFLNSNVKKGNGPSRLLYRVPFLGTAGLHARKVANALRTIDSWHGDANVGAIAVEIYGGSLRYQTNFRPAGLDLLPDRANNAWAILLHIIKANSEEDVKLSVDDQRFILAVLVRGALFAAEKSRNREEEEETGTPADPVSETGTEPTNAEGEGDI